MIQNILWLPEILSARAASALREEFSGSEWKGAEIQGSAGDQAVEGLVRRSSVLSLPDSHWLTSVLLQALTRANAWAFGFDLCTHEATQLTKYCQGDHYHWHCDQFSPSLGEEDKAIGERQTHKLSCMLQLSPSTDYQGGELQIQGDYGQLFTGTGRGEDWRAVGSLIAFPSTVYHTITPVLAGERISAVMWATGPVWR